MYRYQEDVALLGMPLTARRQLPTPACLGNFDRISGRAYDASTGSPSPMGSIARCVERFRGMKSVGRVRLVAAVAGMLPATVVGVLVAVPDGAMVSVSDGSIVFVGCDAVGVSVDCFSDWNIHETEENTKITTTLNKKNTI